MAMIIPQIVKDNWNEILIGLLLILLVVGYFWHKEVTHEAELQKAQVLTQQQMENANYLQNQLEISKQNAESLKKYYEQAQANKVQPVSYFTVTSPSASQAAKQVEQRINTNDKTLPKEALEKTDRTVVTPQPDNKNYQVGVYKISLQKNWEWGIGLGVHNDDVYIPISIQRNYKKDRAIEAEVHVDKIGKVSGGEVKYKIMTDKLFGIF